MEFNGFKNYYYPGDIVLFINGNYKGKKGIIKYLGYVGRDLYVPVIVDGGIIFALAQNIKKLDVLEEKLEISEEYV